MKKILVVAAVVLAGLSAKAQYTPYLNVGAGISTNVVSYTGELGVENNRSRYAATVTSSTSSPENVWSVGPKGYWKISSKRDKTVELFATGAIDVALVDSHPLTITPGVAAKFNLGGFAPQVSLGLPFRENSVLRERPVGLVAGVSVNFGK